MRIAVTGAGGMLGWHVRCHAFARGITTIRIHRDELAEPSTLGRRLAGVDAVIHCAAVNRGCDDAVVEGTLGAAGALAEAVRRADRPVRVAYANSVQARGDTPYGTAKRKAAELLAGSAPGRFSDVVLPHLFGEHARPYHNSFVATFCQDVAQGRHPRQVHDRELHVLHAQDAAAVLVDEAAATGDRSVEPAGQPVTVTGVLAALVGFAGVYRDGELPDLTDRFTTRLFHTYRSYLFPGRYPIGLTRHRDHRGSLVVCVRSGESGGQAFVSSTVPGAVRGEHVHLRKFERYVVVEGRAEIALRRLFTDEVVRFPVSGKRPAIVDMPTLWAHRIVAVGESPVTTFFWTNECYDPADPDTYPTPVFQGDAAGQEAP